ncbi:hypothetical protein PN498_17595 [Oscillatoria sp. CS-180]|nr:hypothetical protein [Oscillatoria sp. CS-180]MDB9527813.1 hypothetical protein [Oscillatoria sp. CS-180]
MEDAKAKCIENRLYKDLLEVQAERFTPSSADTMTELLLEECDRGV